MLLCFLSWCHFAFFLSCLTWLLFLVSLCFGVTVPTGGQLIPLCSPETESQAQSKPGCWSITESFHCWVSRFFLGHFALGVTLLLSFLASTLLSFLVFLSWCHFALFLVSLCFHCWCHVAFFFGFFLGVTLLVSQRKQSDVKKESNVTPKKKATRHQKRKQRDSKKESNVTQERKPSDTRKKAKWHQERKQRDTKKESKVTARKKATWHTKKESNVEARKKVTSHQEKSDSEKESKVTGQLIPLCSPETESQAQSKPGCWSITESKKECHVTPEKKKAVLIPFLFLVSRCFLSWCDFSFFHGLTIYVYMSIYIICHFV